MAYLVWKLLHLVAVMLFLGNITTGVLWKIHAERTRDPALIAHVFAGIIRSDRVFTMPGVTVLVAAGIAAAITGHFPILGTGWILWSIVLLTVSGLAFMLALAPLQRQIATLATDGAKSGRFDWQRYEALSKAWNRWGVVALGTPVLALVLMVLKPDLPAF